MMRGLSEVLPSAEAPHLASRPSATFSSDLGGEVPPVYSPADRCIAGNSGRQARKKLTGMEKTPGRSCLLAVA